MIINETGTARLYIKGEYVADVSLDKADLYEEATKQYIKDENLGRLLWKLDGVKVENKPKPKVLVFGHGFNFKRAELNLNIKIDEYFNREDFLLNNEKHFIKYSNRGEKYGKKRMDKKFNYSRGNGYRSTRRIRRKIC